MKLGVPWSFKGIRPEARETAKEAARRSGLSLDDWLNTVIMQQAAQAGLPGQPLGQTAGNANAQSEELAGVHRRLDDLTRRIEQFTRTGPAAYAPRHQRDQQQTAELIGRLERRIDQLVSQPQEPAPPLAPAAPPPHLAPPPAEPNIRLPPALDRALAEIAARQRILNDEPARTPAVEPPSLRSVAPMPATSPPPSVPPPSFAPPRAAVPTQDISGLEQQLRNITDQIETLRKPGVEEAINALRGELADIGHALDDAMPKQAIDNIEKQIAELSQRVAESRQAGVDTGALAGIEHGLAEVRDALRGLTPAEHLVGFTDAVNSLAQKIDLIVAQKDPATLHQLEGAITTLRGMASNVASNEAVSRLAAEVQELAAKVDQTAGGPVGHVLNNLEARIDALTQALAERAEAGNTVPPRLEALVQSLADKIEQIQHARDDNVAVRHLEDRIVGLVERLDASDSRLGHLEAIERGLADLLVHIEEMRAARHEAPTDDSSAVAALKQDMARSQDAFKEDMARTQDAIMQDMTRTQDALDALHGTLGLVVDRLAVIEKDIRSDRRVPPAPAPVAAAATTAAPAAPATPAAESEPLELTQPVGRLAVRLVDNAPEAVAKPAPAAPPSAAPSPTPAPVAPPVQAKPQPQPTPAPPQPQPPAATQPSIKPGLPPDQPLEPGSGPPQFRAHPSARIAASEAALGDARPAPQAGGSPSNFIAAARRAARAAQQEQEAAAPYAVETAKSGAQGSLSLRAKMMGRMKSLLVAASVIALVVGSAQLVGSRFDSHSGGATKIAQRRDPTPAHAPAAPKRATIPTATNPLMAPATIALPPRQTQTLAPNATNLLSPPALYSGGDITGSIPDAATDQQSATKPAGQHDAASLPSGIGSAQLRQAARAGDAGAAYEVAARFAEGRGVPVDMRRAAQWYARAAAKGLAVAQFRYASMLEKGVGAKKDLARARQLYRAAAAQGNAKAMHNLGVLYAEGADGTPDYAKAVRWFRKAGQHGVADSQYNLGILYARGIGVDKDLVESYKWFALAASHGDQQSAKKRDAIAAELDARQLAAAREAVAHFKPEPQPRTATAVPAPPGGWNRVKESAKNDAKASAKGHVKTGSAKTATAESQARPDGPLPLGSFTIGKR